MEEVTEEQRKRAEANRAAALSKRQAIASLGKQSSHQNPWKLFRCRKPSPELAADLHVPKQSFVPNILGPSEEFLARIEICSLDSFSVTPVAVKGFTFPGEALCFEKLRDCLSNVMLSHYTQNTGGGKACVYRLQDYQLVLKSLKSWKGIECEEIPWGTFNVIERLSHSFAAGKWIPCRPEHVPDEKVDELISELPKTLLSALLPFQLDGVRFGLRRGGRCLLADEMGLGKTLQAIAIAGCFLKEGSILVVCPAILRHSWAEELERWFPFCTPSDIHLVFGHRDNPARLAEQPRVVVISYTMLRRLQKSMLEQEWATLIIDESHHLRCSKKSLEKDELQAVLDVAKKVKHLILLSGTPSLSRPYDIFHQVNMLWPGLLGQTKYEFAKTYCSVKFVKGSQGNVFQDFSKGIRLEELNVLLKETVMIRRLKEHVLLQLPPKRRQIIKLVLKRSDISLAMATLGLKDVNVSADSVAENALPDISDEDQDNEMNKILSTKLSALGIAKLPGFFEWLSLHPIMAELDEVENNEGSSGSHKMIIFAFHHKVLDGVQAFICEKGIQFVRIDCTITGGDRQSAIHSFQSSKEVKIALVGIRAGGSGLNLTSADNVVFLELPTRPGEIQQAEDRAHRHGQKRLVNIYIFCAKDTSDELHWQRLNTSLLRVSSTVNGKHDVIQEMEVESVSNLETACKTREKNKQLMLGQIENEDRPVEKIMKSHTACTDQDSQPEGASSDLHIPVDRCGGGQYHTAISSWRDKRCRENELLELNGKHANLRDEEFAARAEHEAAVCPLGVVEKIDSRSKEMKVDAMFNETTLTKGGCINEVDIGANSSIQSTALRFEVSKYTGRIHLYSCIPGTDSRPRPFFENFRLEEVECCPLANDVDKMSDKSIKDDPLYRGALMEFINEWKKLRPIEKRKLIGKPLQLPLSCELCYLNESINHNDGGLLRGGSRRRKTPMDEISHSLPSNASRRKVHLSGGNDQKEQLYTQGWSNMDEPLCKLCQTPCKSKYSKSPQFFEDLFCTLNCFEEYRSRTSSRFLREGLFQIEKGICTCCQLDCHRLVENLMPLSLEKRPMYIKKVAPKIADHKKLLDKLVHDPKEGNAWHADHIIPVYKGGGECKLENMRTLCVACHAAVTTAQCAERRIARNKAKKQLKDIMNGLTDAHKSEHINNVVQGSDLRFRHNNIEHDLLIDIPGSAYSGANVNTTKDENLSKELLDNRCSHIICPVDGEFTPVLDEKGQCQESENPRDPSEFVYVHCNVESEVITGKNGIEEHGKLSISAQLSFLRDAALEVSKIEKDKS
ncbi:uncharacterized protein [Henckelia pumila]|uniref:uncharacterized protein n=1 Tax=Henckelia pumila TaxID=405737 RepID=UPI003C6DF491